MRYLLLIYLGISLTTTAYGEYEKKVDGHASAEVDVKQENHKYSYKVVEKQHGNDEKHPDYSSSYRYISAEKIPVYIHKEEHHEHSGPHEEKKKYVQPFKTAYGFKIQGPRFKKVKKEHDHHVEEHIPHVEHVPHHEPSSSGGGHSHPSGSAPSHSSGGSGGGHPPSYSGSAASSHHHGDQHIPHSHYGYE